MDKFCQYCINTPKKANYSFSSKTRDINYICKSCIESTILQKMLKSDNTHFQYIQSKQVNRYNLPLDHKYKVIGFDYCGSLLDGGGTSCQNCNRLIVNTATVETEEGKKYTIGCDCAETLSLVDCNDFWKLKEQQAKHRKLVKWIKDIKQTLEAKKDVHIETQENGIYIHFGMNWRYRMPHETYNQYFKQLNLPTKL